MLRYSPHPLKTGLGGGPTMLGALRTLLDGKTVILASASPRRHQLLRNINFPVEVVPSQFEETLDKTTFHQPWRYAEETARGKAVEVASRLGDRDDWVLVIGADTVVVLNDIILEKPGSPVEAKKMLTSLAGQDHMVYTGLALLWRKGQRVCHEATKVTFAPLTSEIIDSYVASGEPLDKAGGYGIQGAGGTLISGIRGDYFNVVGLPLHRLCCELRTILPALVEKQLEQDVL